MWSEQVCWSAHPKALQSKESTIDCVSCADARPEVPDIQVNFHHDYHFEVVLLHVSAISAEMHAAAVSMYTQSHDPASGVMHMVMFPCVHSTKY